MLDRPSHVRAASGLTWFGDRLIVMQDDALFVGVVDRVSGLVDDLALPSAGARTFDTARGNKRDKPDFEAACVVGDTLLAFGSGGPLPARQVVMRWTPPAAPAMIAMREWYATLLEELVFERGALNLEGAVVVGEQLWLGNRGGDTTGTRATPDVLAKLSTSEFMAILNGTRDAAEFSIDAREIELGDLDGVGLHISDLTADARGVWLLAAAEQTTNFFDDGAVMGSVIGRVDEETWTPVRDQNGELLREKLEGFVIDRERADRVWAVNDCDDPTRPAELFEIELDGRW